ncbi:9850_t:CDS:2, partial [Acaulospora colombiana]
SDQVVTEANGPIRNGSRDPAVPGGREQQTSSLDHILVARVSTNDPVPPALYESPQEAQTSNGNDYFNKPTERTTSPDPIVHRPPRKRAVLVDALNWLVEDVQK